MTAYVALPLSPIRPQASTHYNPLAHIHSQEDAEDLAACWTENTGLSREPYYNQIAHLLLTAAVLHTVDTEPDAPFSRLADLLSRTTFDQVRTILTKSKSTRARDIASGFINSIGQDAKLAGGIMSAMATRFLIMKNPTLRTITGSEADPQRNIDFQRLAHTPEALFLSIPASDTRRLRPVTSLLIMQLMNSLAKRQNGKPFVLYMDELANIGKICMDYQGVRVSLNGRMNNATTLLFQCAIREFAFCIPDATRLREDQVVQFGPKECRIPSKVEGRKG